MSNDNITDIQAFKARAGGGEPPAQEPEKVPQYTYKIVMNVPINDELFEKVTYVKRGYLVVTNHNLALIDENNNASFLVPNDRNVISVEVVDDATPTT